MNGADPDQSFADIIAYCKTDQPPLFFLLLHFWFKVFSFNDFYGRLFVAIIGILGVVSVFFLGKEVKNARVGIIAAFITSLNYFQIVYSQEVRFYSLLFLLSSLSFLFFIRSTKQMSIFNFICYSLFTSAAIYTHYYGMVVAGTQALLFLGTILFRPSRRFLLYGLGSGILILIAISPWLPTYFNDSKITNFWIQPVAFPLFLANYFYHYFESYVIATLLLISILYFLGFTFVNYFRKGEQIRIEYWFIFGWIFFSYSIPLVYSVMVSPMLIIRYTIIVLPAILVLVGLGFDSFTERYFVTALIIFVLVTVNKLFFDLHYYDIPRKEQLREVVKEVIKDDKKPAVIFSYYAWHYNYYFKSLDSKDTVTHPLSVDYKAVLDRVDYVWLIQCHEDNIGATNEQLALIEQMFVPLKEIKFIGARGKLFTRRSLNQPSLHK